MKRLSLISLLVLLAAAAQAAPFTVRVEGEGTPMIFIPGLSSSGHVWDGTCAHFAARYQCHILTLAGFAGVEPGKEPLLPAARRELAKYIRDQRLGRPVIIGHSLGGFLALWLAATEPDVTGPVISIDGVPYLAAIMAPGATPEEVAARAESMRAFIASQTAEQFASQTEASLSMMITRKEDVERVARSAKQSDPITVAEALRFMLTTDVRPLLKRIQSPVLLIQPAQGMPEAMIEPARKMYEAQLEGVVRRNVVQAPNARHFAMLDDPRFVFATIESFLAESQAAGGGR